MSFYPLFISYNPLPFLPVLPAPCRLHSNPGILRRGFRPRHAEHKPMDKTALFVGGCDAPYHRLEPAEAPVRAALEQAGLQVEVSGIYHPDGDTPIGDYRALSAENLRRFDALALFTTGSGQGENVPAILEFVRGGGGLIGIHCATDSFTKNADYIAAIGGKFRHHPDQLDVAVEFVGEPHPITQGLPPFTVHDELYLFSDYDPARVRLLAQTHSFDDNGPVPICWIREEGQGRVFYLSLGHNPEVMADPHWQTLFERGVRWALRSLGNE